jgi:hypothetical protein
MHPPGNLARGPPATFQTCGKFTEKRRRTMRVKMNPERVRALLGEKGMGVPELAAAAGITPRTAKRAGRGEPVRVTTARAIAAALGTRPSRTLGEVLHK